MLFFMEACALQKLILSVALSTELSLCGGNGLLKTFFGEQDLFHWLQVHATALGLSVEGKKKVVWDYVAVEFRSFPWEEFSDFVAECDVPAPGMVHVVCPSGNWSREVWSNTVPASYLHE